MELTVGTVLEGKVKSITNFGAFISLPENTTGTVHISEGANASVSDIRQHLTEGQDVKVMVIGTDNGKINLSIKRLEPRQPRENSGGRPNSRGTGSAPRREGGNYQNREQNQNRTAQRAPVPPAAPKTADQLFEEKLKAFMAESDSKLSSVKAYSDHRSKNRRRG